MSIPANLRYAPSHEWARLESDGTVTVGITHHAQDLLGDMVYVENPELGRQLRAQEECAVVESVKAASDVYAPIAGEVIDRNEAVSDSPELINEDAYQHWMFRLRPTNPADLERLLSAEQYAQQVAAEGH